MTQPARQFDPFVQAEQGEVEMDIWVEQGRALVDRMSRVFAKCREENERLRAERDGLEAFSEEEAGIALRLSNDPKAAQRRMADLRRLHNLPHRKLGGAVVYTREDLADILETFRVRGMMHKLKAAA